MPTVLKWKGYRFLFYASDDGEPAHIHVRIDQKQLKIWLNSLDIADNQGFKDHEINEVLSKVKQEQVMFLEKWNEFFK